MTGSNMFLIFRHGVKLLGGEFLRSNGNAAEKRAISWRSQQKKDEFPGTRWELVGQMKHWSNRLCPDKHRKADD